MRKYFVRTGMGLDSEEARAQLRRVQEEQKRKRRLERQRKNTGTQTTMPIEDAEMVGKWFEIAKRHDAENRQGGISWYLLLLLGFNTGLRIGDICTLRVGDIRGHERLRVVAEKTGKQTDLFLPKYVIRAIDSVLEGRSDGEYCLQSRNRDRVTGEPRPVSRQQCWRIVKEIARLAGFREHVGCHSMRKTFAWNFYMVDGNLAKLQELLNHSSQEATIHYLGLDKKSIDYNVEKMKHFV